MAEEDGYDEDEGGENLPFEIDPSELDEATHAEFVMLYHDSQDNIRFAKALQWKTVAGTLAIFVLLAIGGFHSGKLEIFLKILIFISVALSAGSIYALSILLAWQNTERQKLRMIVHEFSNLFHAVYRIKSRTEANVHRHILLSFMVATILLGNYVSASLLMSLMGK